MHVHVALLLHVDTVALRRTVHMYTVYVVMHMYAVCTCMQYYQVSIDVVYMYRLSRKKWKLHVCCSVYAMYLDVGW